MVQPCVSLARTVLLICALFSAVLAQEPVTVPADPADFHIFVLMGQSNMAALGGVVEPMDTVVHAGLHKYWPLRTANGLWVDYGSGDRGAAREWVQGTDPIGPSRWNPRAGLNESGKACGRSFGLQILAATSGIQVGIIQLAVSGSPLVEWTKEGAYYADNVAVMTAAQATGTLKGILWHQGEASTGNGGDYSDMMTQMIADYRADVGVPDLPFIASQIGTTSGSGGVNGELAAVASAVTNMAVTSSDGFTLYDHVHINSQSQDLMGLRLAQAYLDMVGSSYTVPLTIASRTFGAPRGAAYTHLLAAEGGDGGAISWSLVNQLPEGLSLTDGALTGIPTAAAGVYSFTVQATRGTDHVTRELSIDIAEPVRFAVDADTIYVQIDGATEYTLPVSNNGYEPIAYRWFSFPDMLSWGGPWDGDSVMVFEAVDGSDSVTLTIDANAGIYNNNWASLSLHVIPTETVAVGRSPTRPVCIGVQNYRVPSFDLLGRTAPATATGSRAAGLRLRQMGASHLPHLDLFAP